MGNSGGPNLDHVVYSSDYLNFNPGGSYTVDLPNLVNTGGGTGLQLAADGLLQNFIADARGLFLGNVIPATAVPAPSSIAMLGTGALAPLGVLLCRRRRARADGRRDESAGG